MLLHRTLLHLIPSSNHLFVIMDFWQIVLNCSYILILAHLVLRNPVRDQVQITALMLHVPHEVATVCSLLGCLVQIILGKMLDAVCILIAIVAVPPVGHWNVGATHNGLADKVDAVILSNSLIRGCYRHRNKGENLTFVKLDIPICLLWEELLGIKWLADDV